MLVLAVVLLAGCGRGDGIDLVPVTGTVQWKGSPLTGAIVTFVPINETRGGGATGRTDANGDYQLTYVRGGQGTAAGEYKVVISKRIMPDGTPVPENDPTPPADSPAREMLPAYYSDPDQTELKANVQPGAGPIHFDLKAR
jgi:hypothetical protein